MTGCSTLVPRPNAMDFKLAPVGILFLLYRGAFITVIEGAPPSDGHQMMDAEMAKFKMLRVSSPESYDKLKSTHENLYYGAVKALMGQLGKNMYKRLSKGEQRRLAKCLDRIENRFDLKSSAICLVESKRRWMETERMKSNELLAFVQEEEKHQSDSHRKGVAFMQDSKGVTVEDTHKMVRYLEENGHAQRKLQNSHLLEKDERGPKRTESARLIRYGKKDRRRVPRRVEDEFEQLLKTRKQREEWLTTGRMGRRWESAEGTQGNAEERFKIKSMSSSLPLNTDADKSIGSRVSAGKVEVSNLLIKMMGERGEKAENKWTKVHGLLARLAEETERRKKFPGTKVFEKRMYDIVLDREEPSLSPKEKRSKLGLIHEGMKLLDSMPTKATVARNASASQNYRMFSPRFMPLAPDKGGPVNPKSILSPTLFAMYEEKDNNSIVNVPEMLRSAGIGEKDRQKLIAGLMELTGSTNTAEKALQLLKNVDFFEEGVGGPILKATKRTLSAFFALEDSLDRVQRRQCSQNGYTFARKEQIAKLLRDQMIDVQQMPDMAKFEAYDRMSAEEKEMALWATIEGIALDEPVQKHNSSFARGGKNHRRRIKRTFAVHLYEAAILSPFQFAPIYGLVVMGPAVLSPSIFSPYILGPSIFSPLIISPPAFSPLILSPSVASPWILTPGVANPYIISPYVFGPFILGPLLLHPFILSPYVLSPNILNPYALSPIILNPIALSPDIMTPQVLGGAVFSPAFLSPAIFTQTFLMVSIFSPTFLS